MEVEVESVINSSGEWGKRQSIVNPMEEEAEFVINPSGEWRKRQSLSLTPVENEGRGKSLSLTPVEKGEEAKSHKPQWRMEEEAKSVINHSGEWRKRQSLSLTPVENGGRG